MHLIVTADPGRLVEIQVRTKAQHRWAEVSEKLADLLDPAIKYGGGPQLARDSLSSYSETVRLCEELERQHDDMLDYADRLRSRTSDALTSEEHDKLKRDADDLASRVREQRAMLDRSLEEMAEYIVGLVRDSRRDKTR